MLDSTTVLIAGSLFHFQFLGTRRQSEWLCNIWLHFWFHVRVNNKVFAWLFVYSLKFLYNFVEDVLRNPLVLICSVLTRWWFISGVQFFLKICSLSHRIVLNCIFFQYLNTFTSDLFHVALIIVSNFSLTLIFGRHIRAVEIFWKYVHSCTRLGKFISIIVLRAYPTLAVFIILW